MKQKLHSLAKKLRNARDIIFEVPGTHHRLFVDKAFTWADWSQHRNASWRYRLEPLVFLRAAAGFMWQLLLVLAVSILVGLYHEFLVPRGLPPAEPQLATPFNMVSFALSLLLVFKTNSSYARWWEGRICWGQVVNYCRNYTRQLLLLLPPEREHLGRLAVRWVIASVYVMRGHVKKKTAGKCELEARHVLTPSELEWLRQWRNGPMGCAHLLSWIVANSGIEPNHQVYLQEQVMLYQNMSGACERIQKTPIPSAYTRHTSRFVVLYVTLAPLLLWPSTGWATPVVAPLIAFLLLGTENIGVQIEEPFRVLAVDAICTSVEGNLREMEALHFGGFGPAAPPPPTSLATFNAPTAATAARVSGGGESAGSGQRPSGAGSAPGSAPPAPVNPTAPRITLGQLLLSAQAEAALRTPSRAPALLHPSYISNVSDMPASISTGWGFVTQAQGVGGGNNGGGGGGGGAQEGSMYSVSASQAGCWAMPAHHQQQQHLQHQHQQHQQQKEVAAAGQHHADGEAPEQQQEACAAMQQQHHHHQLHPHHRHSNSAPQICVATASAHQHQHQHEARLEVIVEPASRSCSSLHCVPACAT